MAPLDVTGLLRRFRLVEHPRRLERLARWSGGLWLALDRRHRDIAQSNLRLALGCSPREARALAKANFTHLARVALETACLPRFTRDNYRERLEAQGFHHVEESLLQGKGAFLLTGHLGNWEWMARCGPFFLPAPLNVIVRPLDPPWLNEIVQRFREGSGNRIIHRRSSARAMLKALKRNELVGVLFDHNAKRSMAIDAPFFGGMVPTNRGIAWMAIKTGAPVHFAYSWRHPSGRLRVVAHPPFPVPEKGSLEERVHEMTAAFNRSLEAQIRRDPTQWFWVYRRFRKYRDGNQR